MRTTTRKTGFCARRPLATAGFGVALLMLGAVELAAQQQPRDTTRETYLVRQPFVSRDDSLDWARARETADTARGLRLVISLFDRRLWAIADDDTLLATPVAVGRNDVFSYQGKTWRFKTPRGPNAVQAKDSLPVWIPPDWHYYEVADARGLRVRHLAQGTPVTLSNGRRLEIREGLVGVTRSAVFSPVRRGEEIIFDGTLFIPPLGTKNRQVEGELGRYRLTLRRGYALHGTPYEDLIGLTVTHGCIRVGDIDLAWLYQSVPIGTPVYIY